MQSPTPTPAVYTPSPLDLYRGNPLIEALPPIRERAEIANLLRYEPEILPEHRELPATLRKDLLHSSFRFYVPVRETLLIEDKIGRIIRSGYLDRNPLVGRGVVIEVSEEKEMSRQSIAGVDLPPPAINASNLGVTLIGFSGMGKTTTVERVLDLYPQVIRHAKYEGMKVPLTQITHLKLDCPNRGTVRGFCIDFFSAVDRLIGTGYYDVHVNSRSSVQTLMTAMANIARLHAIGVLIIDEIQFLAGKSNPGSPARETLNFITRLTNTVGIPIILIGTPSAREILTKEFRQARRGAGMGNVEWHRWKRGDAFDHFCRRAWRCQYLRNVSEISDEMIETIYEETQGITHLVVTAIRLAQVRALDCGMEELTPGLIRSVVRDEFKELRPFLQGLRRQDIPFLHEQEDLEPDEHPLQDARPANGARSKNEKGRRKKRSASTEKTPGPHPERVGETNLLLTTVESGRAAGRTAADSLRQAGLLGYPNRA